MNDLLTELRRRDIALWREGDNLRFSAPNGALTPELRAELGARKSELLATLSEETEIERAIPCSDRNVAAPLSFSQERLWIVDQIAPCLAMYNIELCWRIRGPLDVEVLERSLNEIARRHDVLRARIERDENGNLVQIAAPFSPRTIPIVVAGISQLLHLAATESEHPFDLSRGPLYRAVLARFGEQDHALLLAWHHLAFDAWSSSIFIRELTALYSAFHEGRANPLPELPIQFGDFARWQRDAFRLGRTQSQLAYWRARLEGDRSPIALPCDRPRPAQQSYRGANRARTFSPESSAAIRAFCRAENVTMFMLLLALWKVLLARFTGETDLCIGSPIAQRSRVETESLIGFFLNMLALRTDLARDPSFREALRRVRATVLDAFENQDVPFEKIVETLHPTRVLSHHPIFQVAFVCQNASEPPPALPGLAVEQVSVPVSTSKFDLTLFATDTADGISVKMEYSTDLFDAETIDGMLSSFELLANAVMSDSEIPISRLPVLAPAERRRLIVDWNATERAFPNDLTVSALFEEIAARTPNAIALIDGADRITYAELNARANAVAHYLHQNAASSGQFIGLPAERSARFISAILGILKAGCAYVPLDFAEAPERLASMRSECALVLDLAAMNEKQSAEIFTSSVNATDAAYVLFTSGSTGVPKGVVVPHRAVNRLVINNDYAPFVSSDVVAFASNVCFDAATFEIWGALLNGGTLVVTPRDVLLSPSALAAHLSKNEISVLFLTTSLFNQLANQAPDLFGGLRHLIFGGEAADVASVRLVLENGKPRRLINGYGPTEATTFAACHTIERIDGANIPIGKPIANTTIYILDAALQPVPIGVTGEIFIGGPGVAIGYHGAPELNAERFLQTEFGRVYRTGDLARWLRDGTIEFRGRSDAQVKLRGFRIEPGEIEHAMRQISGVKDCRAFIRNSTGGSPQLVAFFISNAAPSPGDEELRTVLARTLPAHMIPSAFAAVESFPLTANGKLDCDAFPSREKPRVSNEPKTPVEREIAAVWSEILGKREIGIRDDFFMNGGHSLLAIQLLGKLRAKFGIDLPVQRLFATPTIAGIADFIGESRGTESPAKALQSLVCIQRGDERRLPFFLVPGGWGGEIEFLVYGMLKHHLSSEIPLYGLRARGSDGITPPHENVPEMVADYVAEIRSRQPHGPYLLGGECVGGVVAYEMARLLESQGEAVALLALLDTGRPSRNALRAFCAGERENARRRFWEARVRQPMRDHFRNLSRLSLGEKIRYIWTRSTRKRSWHSETPATRQADCERKLAMHYPKLLLGYKIGAYSGKVTLLIPEDSHRRFGNQGWDEVPTGGLDVHVLPGDHVTYIRDHAASAGARLREIIDRASSTFL